SRASSSSLPWPRSIVTVTISARYLSASHEMATDVSSPPEYARTIRSTLNFPSVTPHGRAQGPPLRHARAGTRPAPTTHPGGHKARPYDAPGRARGPPLRRTRAGTRPAPTTHPGGHEARPYDAPGRARGPPLRRT